MKVIFTIWTILITLSGCHYTNAQGFRGIKWGSTQAEVIKKDGKPIEQANSTEGHIIVYEKSVAGIPKVVTSYTFSKDKLHTGQYIFDNLTKAQLATLFNSLVEKYANPKRYVATDRSVQFQWLKKDTRITLSKGVFGGHVVNYYYNSHYVALENNYRKRKNDGL